jgi:hypothetical protein
MTEDTKELGRRLASARQQVESVCLYCGEMFTGYKHRKYCSNKHRVAAFRAAKKESEQGQKDT